LSVVKTISLSKKFGKVTAVDNISFSVEEGEIFGFLGPNGAGKSTTMMILTTLLKPTTGEAIVAGYDVRNEANKVRANIGYVQQETSVDEYLTGRENLYLQARMNHMPKNLFDERINEVLGLVELTAKQNDAVLTYSGGMRKRLDIAGGLLHRPKILFLDEPTVGLDIQTRIKIWQYIKKIYKEFGMSIFLSTHYMEEADNLCDRIGIIDHGKIQVIDSPQNLKKKLGHEIITFTIDNSVSKHTELEIIISSIESVKNVTSTDELFSVHTSNGTEVIPKIFNITSKLQVKINSISLTKPTLDDVFISYTGHDLRDQYDGFDKRKERRRIQRISS
jgi:ABC-2 type transport system ATP-binding protein